MRRRLRIGLAISCAVGAVALMAVSGSPAQPNIPDITYKPTASSQQLARGRQLFQSGCSSCHGFDLRGRKGSGPSLIGAGAAAADFYLTTGRMPLSDPRDEPVRTRPAYRRADIDALVAYVGSFGGPPVQHAYPSRGRLADGLRAFTDHCAGCHQIVGQGGIVTGGVVPDLHRPTPTQIAEAVRVGPYLMPRFSERLIDQHELDSIVRYIEYTRHPADRGGWGIGHIGPIPEGLVAWMLAGVALLIVVRLIGERTA